MEPQRLGHAHEAIQRFEEDIAYRAYADINFSIANALDASYTMTIGELYDIAYVIRSIQRTLVMYDHMIGLLRRAADQIEARRKELELD